VAYQAQSQLENDVDFQQRDRAVCIEQANTYRNDQRPDFVAVAEGILRNQAELFGCFVRLASSGPGIADKVDNGDGTIDSANVTDADLLSLTQAAWPTVAGLYFDSSGTPVP